MKTADINDDGRILINDPIFGLNYLFDTPEPEPAMPSKTVSRRQFVTSAAAPTGTWTAGSLNRLLNLFFSLSPSFLFPFLHMNSV